MALDLRNFAARGQMFAATTAAAGVAPGTALGTTAAYTLFNPATATVNLWVVRVTVTYVSGTLGAGGLHYVANTNASAAAVTGTAITPVCTRLGSSATAVGKAFTTATLPASPTLLRPFCGLQASLATTATSPWQLYEEVNGEFIVNPGCALSLEGITAAGSSPLLQIGVVWYEY